MNVKTDRLELLKKLPPYRGIATMIEPNQTVGHIITETINAHKFFAKDYDVISDEFDFAESNRTLKELFSFLKSNVRYREEPEHRQTSKSPAAIVATREGDCKHYSLFIGGVLDSLNRKGRNWDWAYRFASYNHGDSEPGHVFIVVRKGDREIWVDPVLETFDSRRMIPASYTDKKIKSMPLYRVAGVPEFAVTEEITDPTLTPEVENAIRLLLYYGVMNTEGKINDSLLISLQKKLPLSEYVQLVNARKFLHKAAVGGLFGDIWHGVKKVALSVPRNAYLSLVGVNAFGLATKLGKVIRTGDNWKRLWAKWESLGGRPSALENTILDGEKKKAILAGVSVGAAPAIPAWVAAASAIIAAIAPIIKDVLGADGGSDTGAGTSYPYGICDDMITPRNADGTCPVTPGGGGAGSFLKDNWPLLAIAGFGVYMLMKKR